MLVGDRVKVVRGPSAGLAGEITRVDHNAINGLMYAVVRKVPSRYNQHFNVRLDHLKKID